MAVSIVILVLLFYVWLTLNIAVLVGQRLRQFSLRSLLIAITIAAPIMFFVTRLGPIESILFTILTFATAFAAAVRIKFYSK
jgi:hypothetical protein